MWPDPVRDYGTLLLVLLEVGGGASGVLIFFAVGRILIACQRSSLAGPSELPEVISTTPSLPRPATKYRICQSNSTPWRAPLRTPMQI